MIQSSQIPTYVLRHITYNVKGHYKIPQSGTSKDNFKGYNYIIELLK